MMINGVIKIGIELRSGEYGNYYTNSYDSSNALDMDQMKLNAYYIYDYLRNKSFTKNAICGMLGNMQTESTINPGRWQGDRVGGEPSGHGYGLVQWTPYTKYTNWIGVNNHPEDMNHNLERICYEVDQGIQWIATNTYNFSFYNFTRSTETPEYLALAFLACYERPADPNQPIRATQARFWWNYLTDEPPTPPTPPVRVQNTKKWLMSNQFKINIRW